MDYADLISSLQSNSFSWVSILKLGIRKLDFINMMISELKKVAYYFKYFLN